MSKDPQLVGPWTSGELKLLPRNPEHPLQITVGSREETVNRNSVFKVFGRKRRREM